MTPGAYTKILVDLSHTKTAALHPTIFGIKPGYDNTSSTITMAGTTATGDIDWSAVTVKTTTADKTVFGIIIDCFGF
jgi:hypothetical protein